MITIERWKTLFTDIKKVEKALHKYERRAALSTKFKEVDKRSFQINGLFFI
jgi:hypothetical protein